MFYKGLRSMFGKTNKQSNDRVQTAMAWLKDPRYKEMNFYHHIDDDDYRSFSEAMDAFIASHGRRPVTYHVGASVGVSRYSVGASSEVDQTTGVFRLVFTLMDTELATGVNLGLDHNRSPHINALCSIIEGFATEATVSERLSILSSIRTFYARMLEENYGAQTLLDDQCDGTNDEFYDHQTILADGIHGELTSDVEYTTSTLSARHIEDVLTMSKYYKAIPPTGFRVRIFECDEDSDRSAWVLKCVGYRWKLELAEGKTSIRSFGVTSPENAHARLYSFIMANMFKSESQEQRVRMAKERASYVKRLIEGVSAINVNFR